MLARARRHTGVYAIFMIGSSMELRFMEGKPLYVSATRAPAVGDDVLLETVKFAGDAYSRRYVRKFIEITETEWVLKMHNPVREGRLKAATLKFVHRIFFARGIVIRRARIMAIFHKGIVVSTVCALVLSGCATYAERKAAAMRDDDETCRNMGFELGSDDYKRCRFTSYQARENRQAMIGVAYAGRPRTYQTFQLPQQNSYVPALNFGGE